MAVYYRNSGAECTEQQFREQTVRIPPVLAEQGAPCDA